MKKATLDRFEGAIAVLIVNGTEERRPRSSLSAEAKEGDVIDLETGQIDPEATERLRDRVREARRSAFKKSRGPGTLD